MRRWRFLFLAVGVLGLAVLLLQVDLDRLRGGLDRLGIGLAVAVAIHAAVLLVDSIVLLLGTAQPITPQLVWRSWQAQIAGHAINLSTPGGSLGEATKFTLLADRLPRAEVAAAVLVQNVLWFEVNCVLIVTVATIAPRFVPMTRPFDIALAIAAALFLAGGVAVPVLLRTAPWRWPYALLRRLRLSAERVERVRAFVDAMVADVRLWSANRRRATVAVALTAVARTGAVVENWVFIVFLGGDVHPIVPFLMLVNGQIISWLTQIVPFQAGTAEGGAYLLFKAIGVDGGLGVLVELAKKATRLGFVGAGVAILGVQSLRRRG